MKLLIKNMVSIRCKMIVRSELENLHIPYSSVEIGEAVLMSDLTAKQHSQLNTNLSRFGLEIMEDKRSKLIEKIKNIVVELIHYSEEPPTQNFSTFISEKLNYEYKYLSNLFSEVKGTTIEQFIISHKIERAKELIVYEELTLTEIAHRLHYSSVGHLSAQFKKVTGLTPSFFRKMKTKRMIPRDEL